MATSDDGEGINKKIPWRRRINPLKTRHLPPVPEEREVSREFFAGFFSLLTSQWMAYLVKVGYQRPLELNDIPLINPTSTTESLTALVKDSFTKRSDRGSKRPLAGALYGTFKKPLILSGIYARCGTVVQILMPLALKYLIAFATTAYYAEKLGTPAPSIASGLGWVFGITGMQIVQSLGNNHWMYQAMLIGGQSRSVLIALVFDKAMTISNRAKVGGKTLDVPPSGIEPGSAAEKRWFEEKLKVAEPLGDTVSGKGWGNGRITNLMSTDTYRIDQASGFFHMLWMAPISICVALALLIVNLGPSALAGFGLFFIPGPLIVIVIKSLFRFRVDVNKITDQRVSLTQEILHSIRFIKVFGWESAFMNRVAAVRTQEIKGIQVVLAIRNGINAIGMSMPIFASILAFLCYSLTNHNLNPADVFSSLAFFNVLRMPLQLLPLVIGQVTDAFSSIDRIQEFLMAEDQHDDTVWDLKNTSAITMEQGDFTWEQSTAQNADEAILTEPPTKWVDKGERNAQKGAGKVESKKQKGLTKESKTVGSNGKGQNLPADPPLNATNGARPFHIRDINLDFGRTEFIAVIGSVGSGKSSLMAALAGDMRRTRGSLTLGCASRAYCPQYAWIQNATLKENIVFSGRYDQEQYDKVIDACALRPDLEMLPNGSLTEIGERGINLSGGQKQRVNIARAIYSDAEIILMDDPLLAVDAQVGNHIMNNAICGLLKNKCRVLATHQLHFLTRCDRIIMMKEGQIEAMDSYNNLMLKNAQFQRLMATVTTQKETIFKRLSFPTNTQSLPTCLLSDTPGAALMQVEDRAVKNISTSVYTAYLRASGSIFVGLLVPILLIFAQAANIVTNLWLAWWTEDKFGYPIGVYIGIYAALGVVQALLVFLFTISLTVFGTRASRTMLYKAMSRVLRAPMSFFDITPLGRITNRLTKDIDVMDNNLTDAIRMFLLTSSIIVSIFILIIVYYYYFVVALVPLSLIYAFVSSYYRASAIEIKRHEAILRSNLFAGFTEAIFGTATLKAYGVQDIYSKRIRGLVDDMDSAYYLTFSNQRWLSILLDAIGASIIFTVAILVVTSRFDVSPAIGGLVLSYMVGITQMMQFTVRQMADVENHMNATERVHYYGTELEQEAPYQLGVARDSWPECGEIVFKDASMRYRPSLPLTLQCVTLHIRPAERVGVVGRTGAGKSSIINTLFRITELESGSITIDGVNINTVGLHELRSRIAIIPQDPTLFRGTIRSNLDPFNTHTDLELWSSLRQAHLIDEVSLTVNESGRIQLDSTVEDEGLNFSLGQRQLLALARALVRDCQIIVCDEATISVDFATDANIQQTMAEAFKGKTLLCVAHRLKTILSYDRICVMDRGCVVEFDTPTRLYDAGGIFRGMCDNSSITRDEIVRAGDIQ